jgi:lysophospholipase L1-like esterase
MRRSPAQLARPQRFSKHFPNLQRGYDNGRGIVTLVGNSLTRSQGAGTDGVLLAARPVSLAARIARNLAAIGGTQGDYSLMWSAPSDNYYVPPITYGTGWAGDPGLRTLWGPSCRNSTTNSDIVVTPSERFSALEMLHWFESGNAGTYEVRIDATLVDSIDMNSLAGVVRKTYYVPLDSHTITITRTSGNAALVALRVWDHTRPCLQIETAAISGRTTEYLGTDNLYAINLKKGANTRIGSHAYFVEFGDNDKGAAGLTAAQFKSNLKGILGLLQNSNADVCDVIPMPSDPTHVPPNDQDATWRQVHYEVCQELGLMPPLDIHALFDTWAIANANGWMWDFAHANAKGYEVIGDAYTRKLMGRTP